MAKYLHKIAKSTTLSTNADKRQPNCTQTSQPHRFGGQKQQVVNVPVGKCRKWPNQLKCAFQKHVCRYGNLVFALNSLPSWYSECNCQVKWYKLEFVYLLHILFYLECTEFNWPMRTSNILIKLEHSGNLIRNSWNKHKYELMQIDFNSIVRREMSSKLHRYLTANQIVIYCFDLIPRPQCETNAPRPTT